MRGFRHDTGEPAFPPPWEPQRSLCWGMKIISAVLYVDLMVKFG